MGATSQSSRLVQGQPQGKQDAAKKLLKKKAKQNNRDANKESRVTSTVEQTCYEPPLLTQVFTCLKKKDSLEICQVVLYCPITTTKIF